MAASGLTDIDIVDIGKNDGNGESQNHSACGIIFSAVPISSV